MGGIISESTSRYRHQAEGPISQDPDFSRGMNLFACVNRSGCRVNDTLSLLTCTQSTKHAKVSSSQSAMRAKTGWIQGRSNSNQPKAFCLSLPSLYSSSSSSVFISSQRCLHQNVTRKYNKLKHYRVYYILVARGNKSKRRQHCCFTHQNTLSCLQRSVTNTVYPAGVSLSSDAQKNHAESHRTSHYFSCVPVCFANEKSAWRQNEGKSSNILTVNHNRFAFDCNYY